jgi:CHAT domain-containing protein
VFSRFRTLRFSHLHCRSLHFLVLLCLSLLICLWFGQRSVIATLPNSYQANASTGLRSNVESLNATQLVQRGVEHYQQGAFSEAIEVWIQALERYQAESDLGNAAIVLENLARAYQALGQTESEIYYWEQTIQLYRQMNNLLQVGRIATEWAQAYTRNGQYQRAIDLLCGSFNRSSSSSSFSNHQFCEPSSALGIAQSINDRLGEAAALGSLGDVYRLRGGYQSAIEVTERSLAIAQGLEHFPYQISAFYHLGQIHLNLAQADYRRARFAEESEQQQQARIFRQAAQEQDGIALRYLQQSQQLAQATNELSSQLRSLLSAIPPSYRTGATREAETQLQAAQLLWKSLPNSQEKVSSAITLARLLQFHQGSGVGLAVSQPRCTAAISDQAKLFLERAVSIAQRIENSRAESFALGELGHWYECVGEYEQALQLTHQAQLLADQSLQMRDGLYLWQWQAGRILKAKGKPQDAVRAYDQAITTLTALSEEILIANQEVRFDFRDTIEPLYREAVDLRLAEEQPSVLIPSTNSDANINRVLTTIDSLKLAELQNYFGNDCVLVALSNEGIQFVQSDPTAAVFSTIILNDRTAVIVSIQDENRQIQQRFEWVRDEQENDIPKESIIDTINNYRKGLDRTRDAVSATLGGYDPALATQLYNWLIRPFEDLLDERNVQTLVFVQDGIFRSVPMTALYDGNQFLIERYAITTTPSLNLTNFEPLNRRQVRALALGLTEQATVDDRVFSQLNYVASELQAVTTILPDSVKLLNQNFTRERLRQALEANTYPVIHIATHGQFSFEAEDAFLVSGFDPNQNTQKITINDLDDLIRSTSLQSPVELLVLSACQTATGDDRAALGLAGIAAQAGARSVLASLWAVNDQATAQLITRFYEGLFEEQLSRAKALQAAQIELIRSPDRTAHPAFWSAFILIGNWL